MRDPTPLRATPAGDTPRFRSSEHDRSLERLGAIGVPILLVFARCAAARCIIIVSRQCGRTERAFGRRLRGTSEAIAPRTPGEVGPWLRRVIDDRDAALRTLENQ
jgi:hypothetical protein